MKTSFACLCICLLATANLNCKQQDEPTTSTRPAPVPSTAPAPGSHAPAPAVPANETAGTVLETMDSGGYTYVRLQTGGSTVWAAGPQTTVKVGQTVRLAGGMPMQNFQSKTLNRTFDTILFVNEIVTASAATAPAGMPPGHPPIAEPGRNRQPATQTAMKPGSIAKAEGGFTVAELYAKKKELAGKRVSVRGQVVKSASNIMGKNWLHIQDGTGDAESFDLTVTTKDTAKVGDTVLVSGTLAMDKDIGAGYFFALIIEDAEIKADK